MREFSVVMGLVDYIPVLLFAVSGVLMMRDLYRALPKYGFAMLAAGLINVFCAGFLKATWKLLYAMAICDFEILNKMFLPTQSLGFLMAGLAMVILVTQKKNRVFSAVPPAVFSGSAIFLVMMVLGFGCVCTCLSILAARLKKKAAIVLFVLAFLASMGMGYAGRLDHTLSWVNWLEQSINIVSQTCLLGGVLMLHKAGLKDA